MTAYLLSVSGAVFLSVIVSFLIPDGKLNKTVSLVLRLICILIIISPITQIFKIDDGQVEIAADIDFVVTAYTKNQNTALKESILNEFNIDCDCDVEIEYSDGEFVEKSVTVKISQKDLNLIDQIYAYLEKLNYINITVYADA